MATLTERGRRTRSLAFSRRTARLNPPQQAPVREVVMRPAHGMLSMPLEAFAELDHVQLCQRMGLYGSNVVGGRPEGGRR